MNRDVIEVIKEFKDVDHLEPATKEEILSAEQELGLKFAEDYICYVSEYGAVSANGVELTGITHYDRLNVVSVTQEEKEFGCYDIPPNMYVIEDMHIEGILGLQDETGTCYVIAPFTEPQKTADSLADYLETYLLNRAELDTEDE